MGDQKDRMLRGDRYLADDPELTADRQRCRLLVERFNATSVTDQQQRVELLRALLGQLGDDTEILPPLQCDYGYPIRVGARSFINYGAIILDCALVTRRRRLAGRRGDRLSWRQHRRGHGGGRGQRCRPRPATTGPGRRQPMPSRPRALGRGSRTAR